MFHHFETWIHGYINHNVYIHEYVNRKKLKNFFSIFGKLVRCEGLPFFVCGQFRKLSKFVGGLGPGYKTYILPSYDLDTPSDALDKQIGPSVWPLRCFKVIKPEPLKTGIWEIPVFSIGTFIGSKIMHEQAATTPKLNPPKPNTPKVPHP